MTGRKWLGSVAMLLVGAGLAWGQVPPSDRPHPADAARAPSVQQPAEFVPPPAVDSSPVPGAPADCGNPACGSFFLCGRDPDHSRVWFQAEYLLWWVRPGGLPPVVGTAPANLVAAGTLPADAITPLLGSFGNGLDYHEQSGVRLSLGAWLDDCQDWGFDAGWFQLQQKSRGATFTSGGDPVIGPVFFDPNTNTRNLITASLPNFTTGPLAGGPRSAVVAARADNRLWGAEVNVRKQIGAVFFADHLDLLVGFRHLQFGEGIAVVTDSTPLAGNGGPALHIEDHLGVLNQFYGGQVGLASHTQLGRWSFDAIGKLALGDMHEANRIEGATTLTAPGLNVATVTGVLAEPTNIGRPTRERFAVVPELTFNVGYSILENVRVTLGYDFLYVSKVMRAGDLVDGVDARQVRALASFDPTAPATRPTFQQHDSRFWAQGLNLGLEVRY
jgi:hypothetical protein